MKVISRLGMLVALLAPRSAYACRCLVQSPSEAYASSAAVFIGRPVQVIGLTAGAYSAYEVHVERVFKGNVAAIAVIYAFGGGGTCDSAVRGQGPHLFYATANSAEVKLEHVPVGALVADGCFRTKPVEIAADDLALLGTGSAPIPGGNLDAE